MSARFLVLGLVFGACGITPGAEDPSSENHVFEGRLTFDARHPTPQGTSAEIEVRPARFVGVALIEEGGAVLAETTTDEQGAFQLRGPGDAASVRFLARVEHEGHDIAIATDANGNRTHAMHVPIEDPSAAIAAHAEDAPGDAGAFHVLDTLLRGLTAVHTWTGRNLPPLYAYWVRGGTREWSFYRGERPAGSGRYALELLGGDPGQASITDTDEHDEAIILHELGHFVMDRLSSDSSTGGMHPRGAHIDPGVAWEEGRATWFALAVLGAPLYQDTIGVEPWGRLRVDENLESGEDPVAGIASETSVAKVLWDLSDGPPHGLPDEDSDGVAVGPAAILQAMIAQADPANVGAFPSLPSFLQFLTASGVVDRAPLAEMLNRTGEPAHVLPPDAARTWPRELPLGARVGDRIDGLTQPAPSGGLNLPITGFDANRTYIVHVEGTGMLMARLTIEGTGREADNTNLTLELRDMRADRLAIANTEEPVETLMHLATPGYYIVRVRDAGGGNRASYSLEVRQESLD